MALAVGKPWKFRRLKPPFFHLHLLEIFHHSAKPNAVILARSAIKR